MNGFEKIRIAKKKKIEKAAYDLIFSNGDDENISISEIAAKAKVSQVTIYNYYGSKNELLKKVFFDLMEEKWLEFKELLNKDIGFPEKIETIVFDKQKITHRLRKNFLNSIISKNKDVQDYIEDFYKNKTVPFLMSIIEQGRSEGYISDNISTEAILIYVQIFKDAVTCPEFLSMRDKNIQAELVPLFFYGLLGEKLRKNQKE